MAQAKRSQYAHWIDVTPDGTETYEIEGIGVEALSMEYNKQIDTYKTILSDTADSVFQNYDIQSSISGKRIYRDDAIYNLLDGLRRNAKALETTLIEVDMGKATGSSYTATKYNILIAIDEFLGENATIGYSIFYKNPVQGTVVITAGKPVFTESASL